MAYTLASDVALQLGTEYSTAQQTRLTSVLIPRAERELLALVGGVAFHEVDRTTDASQDWLLATAILADAELRAEDPNVRAALQGPYQSEKLGDYSYTLKSGGVASSGSADSRLLAIVSRYRVGGAGLLGLVVNGPTRNAPAIVDWDVDVSRGLS